MGLISRIFRLCKADLHGVMDQMEDKGLLLKQYLREMEDGLKEKEQQLSKLSQSCQQIERDLNQRLEEVQKLEKDLDLAVLKEKDEIARALIQKRRTLQNTCSELQHQKTYVEEEKEETTGKLEQQRLQYDQLKIKVTSFCQQLERETPDAIDASTVWKVPTQEEIELELIQRKEVLRQGGAK